MHTDTTTLRVIRRSGGGEEPTSQLIDLAVDFTIDFTIDLTRSISLSISLDRSHNRSHYRAHQIDLTIDLTIGTTIDLNIQSHYRSHSIELTIDLAIDLTTGQPWDNARKRAAGADFFTGHRGTPAGHHGTQRKARRRRRFFSRDTTRHRGTPRLID